MTTAAIRRHRLLSSSALLPAAGLIAMLPGTAFAQDGTWDGQTNSDWATGTNWDTNAVPGPTGIVSINGAGGPNQPVVSSNQTSGLVLLGGGSLTINATLTSDVIIANSGVLRVNSGGQIVGVIRIDAGTNTSSNDGTITGALAVNGGSFINAGVVTGPTTLFDGVLNLNAGSNLADNQSLSVFGGTLNLNTTETVGGLTGTGGTINVSAGNRLAVDQAGNSTFSGAITAAVSNFDIYFQKLGAGTLTLAGNNTGTGRRELLMSGGTLQLQGGNAIGDQNSLTVAGGTVRLLSNETIGALLGGPSGTLDINGQTLTLAGIGQVDSTSDSVNLAGSGVFRIAGPLSSTRMEGAHSFTGLYQVSAGNLELTGTGSASASLLVDGGSFTLTGNRQFSTVAQFNGTMNGTGTVTAASNFDVRSGPISVNLAGSVGLDKTTADTVTLSGANTYTGTTTVSAGTLVAASSGALGTAAGGTVVSSGATLALQGNITIGDAITISGTGVGGGGALRSLSGTTSVTGLVTLAANARINADSDPDTEELALFGGISGNNVNLTLGGAGRISIDSPVQLGTGGLTIDGAGVFALSGANTFTGDVNLNNGFLQLLGGAALSDTVRLTMSAPGVLQVFDPERIGSLSGSGTITLQTNGTFSVGDAADTTFSGVIEEFGVTGRLEKLGTGTLTLTGNNIYTGTTTISGGTLRIGDGGTSGTLGTGAVTNNAALVFNRSDDFTAGNIISGTGSLTKQGAGTLTLTGANSYGGLTTVSAGTLLISDVAGLGTAAGGTLVENGATIAFTNSARYDIQDIVTINGNGVGGAGALQGRGFDVVIANPLVLGSDSLVGLNTGVMTLNGVSGLGRNLTVNTLPNTVMLINGNMALGSGGLTKTGTGLLAIFRPNDWTGDLTINAGLVQIGPSSGAPNTIMSDTARVVLNGGDLRLLASETIGSLAGNAGTTVGDFGDRRTLTFGGNNENTTYAGVIAQGLSIVKTGTGTTTLTGNNNYSGTTTISQGTLQLGNGGPGGTLGTGTVVNNGTLVIDRFASTTLSNVIEGSGVLIKRLSTILTLLGNNTFSGGVRLEGGQINLRGSSSALGTGTLTMSTGTTLFLENRGTTLANAIVLGGGAGSNIDPFDLASPTTLTGVLSGGQLNVVGGSGRLVLTGANNYGATTIAAGNVLQIGNGGTTGTLGTGDVTNRGTLVFDRSDNITVSNTISGTGSLIKQGAGTLTLGGNNTYAGLTSVNAGTLSVTGAIAGAVNVNNGGTLGGTGSIGGAVRINGGGTLSVGLSPGTMTMASLALENGSTSIFELGEAGVVGGPNNDLINVTGELALNGGNFVIERGAGFGSGQYTLITFGSLSGSLGNITLDPVGGGFFGNLALGNGTLLLNTAAAAELVVWNGSTLSPTGAVVGGDGIWSLGGANFTNAAGNVSGPWAGNGALAVFDGTGGVVTIAAGETVAPGGISFAADGYSIVGGDAASRLELAGPTGINTVGGITATIAAVIEGSGSLTKTGTGTLVLSADNTFTGPANVLGGVLVNEGTLAADVIVGATFTNSGTLAGALTVGAGGSAANGLGAAINGAADIALGGVLTNAGTLGAVTNAGQLTSTGSITGGLTNNGSAAIEGVLSGDIANGGTITLTGATTGIGALTQTAAGLFDNSAFATDIGSLAGGGTVEVASGGIFTFGADGSATTFAGGFEGSGQVVKAGAGTFTLTGTSGLTGAFQITEGAVVVAAGASLGGNVTNAASLTSEGTLGGGLTQLASGSAVVSGTLNGAISNAGLITVSADLASNGLLENTLGRVIVDTGASWTGLAGIDNASADATGILVNGMLATGGDITNRAGARLAISGTGTLDAAAIINAGTLVSTGTVLGNLANSAAANLAGTLNGNIANSGTITLTGTTAGIGNLDQMMTGVFDLGGFATTVNAIGGSGRIELGTASLTVAAGDAGRTFGGVIAGSGGLIKNGAGTLRLAGLNTYSGLTTVNAGLLQIEAGGAIAGAVQNNASLTNGGIIGGNAVNNGTMTNLGRINGNLTNNASLALGGQVDGNVDNNAAVTSTGAVVIGRYTQAAGASSVFTGGTVTLGSLAGAGTISLAGTALTAGSDNTSAGFAGAISGNGALTKIGTGTLTLSGTNTFAGNTLVSAGTLAVTNGAGLAGSVVNNATFSNAGTIGGLVVNTGTLSSTGTLAASLSNQGGTANLRGAVNGDVFNTGLVTLTGATTGIVLLEQTAAGRFDLAGFDTALGALLGAGNVTLGTARLTVGSANTNTLFSGVISGSGALTKVGTGRLVLTGANAYAGGTTISGGVLQLGDGGTSGSIAGPVINNSALVINRSDAFTFANAISGSGMVMHDGTGTTTLTGANSYSGGTRIARGRLVGTTTALQGLIQIDSGAALEFAQGTAGTFAGQLTGAGLFDKTGAGLLTLTGNSNAFTGATSVRGGELRVNGGLAGSVVTVGSGTTLSGTGVIGGLVAQSGSTIAPGTSPGTLSVAGNISLQAGSTTVFEISAAGPSDLILATGTAALGGTASLVNLGGTYAFNSEYVLLSADGGRSGTFAAAAGTGNFGILYRPELIYTPNQVRVRMAPNLLANIVGNTALTANQRAVVNRIDGAVIAGYNPQPLFNVYTLPSAQLPGAFDQLSGEAYATAAGVGIDQERMVREAVLGRLGSTALTARTAPESASGLGVWGQLFGGWGDGDSDGNAAAYEADRMGFVTGLDYGNAGEGGHWRAGLFGMRIQSDVTIPTRGSASEVEQWGGGAYAALGAGGFGAVIGGYLADVDLRTFRDIALPGFAETNVGTTQGKARQAFAELSYSIAAGDATIRPFVAGSVGSFRLDSLTETGGAAALAMREQRYDTGSLTGGVDGAVAVGKRLRLEGMVAARRQLGDRAPEASLALAAAPQQAFAIRGVQLDKTALSARLEALLQLEENLSITVGYSGLIGETIKDHAARATIQVQF